MEHIELKYVKDLQTNYTLINSTFLQGNTGLVLCWNIIYF